MNAKVLILVCAIMVQILLFAPNTHAHSHKSDGIIGVLLHAEPGDKPVAKAKTQLYFYVSDKANTFTSAGCDCGVAISRNGKKLTERPMFGKDQLSRDTGGSNAIIEYAFPEPGIYKVQIVGTPKVEGQFKPFDFALTQRVEKNINPLAGMSVWPVLGGLILVGVVFAGIKIGKKLNWSGWGVGQHARGLVAKSARRPKAGWLRHPAWSASVILLVLAHVAFIAIGFVAGHLSQKFTQKPADQHAQHTQLAQQGGAGGATAILGLAGDRTKRYTVSFAADSAVAGQDAVLRFRVYDAASGTVATTFSPLWTKLMHLVIVDEELNYYSHIHPEFVGGEFVVTTQFPRDGHYRLYTDFQPLGAIEQQFGFAHTIGGIETGGKSVQAVDTSPSKVFGAYTVNLNKSQFSASQATGGKEKLSFTFKDTATGQPVKNLKPYLGAFGHLVMINQETYQYIHVHPANAKPVPEDATGGPVVEFVPLGLYGPIKPGTYRVFGQFNPAGELMTADFTVRVK